MFNILPDNTVGATIGIILVYIMLYNGWLGVFNLIPLPPLDGSKILLALLPRKAQEWYENHETILYIVFIIVWVTPIMSALISPVVNGLYNFLISFI